MMDRYSTDFLAQRSRVDHYVATHLNLFDLATAYRQRARDFDQHSDTRYDRALPGDFVRSDDHFFGAGTMPEDELEFSNAVTDGLVCEVFYLTTESVGSMALQSFPCATCRVSVPQNTSLWHFASDGATIAGDVIHCRSLRGHPIHSRAVLAAVASVLYSLTRALKGLTNEATHRYQSWTTAKHALHSCTFERPWYLLPPPAQEWTDSLLETPFLTVHGQIDVLHCLLRGWLNEIRETGDVWDERMASFSLLADCPTTWSDVVLWELHCLASGTAIGPEQGTCVDATITAVQGRLSHTAFEVLKVVAKHGPVLKNRIGLQITSTVRVRTGRTAIDNALSELQEAGLVVMIPHGKRGVSISGEGKRALAQRLTHT